MSSAVAPVPRAQAGAASTSFVPQPANSCTTRPVAGTRLRPLRKPRPRISTKICSARQGSVGQPKSSSDTSEHDPCEAATSPRGRVRNILASIGVGVGLVVGPSAGAATVKEQQELTKIVENRTGASEAALYASLSPRSGGDGSARSQRKLSPELLKDIQKQKQHEILDGEAAATGAGGDRPVVSDGTGVKTRSPGGSGGASWTSWWESVSMPAQQGVEKSAEPKSVPEPKAANNRAAEAKTDMDTTSQAPERVPSTAQTAAGKPKMAEDQVADGALAAAGLLLASGAGVAVYKEGAAKEKRREASADECEAYFSTGAEERVRQVAQQAKAELQGKDKLLQRLESTLRETEESAAKQVELERQAAETARTEKELMKESLMAEMQLVDAMRDECKAMDNVLAAEEESMRRMEQEARGVFDALERAKDIIREGRIMMEWNDFDLMTKRFNDEVAIRAALRAGLEEAETAIDEQIEDQQKRIEQIPTDGQGFNGLVDVLYDMKKQAFEMVHLAESLTNEAAEQKAKTDGELDRLLSASNSAGGASRAGAGTSTEYREALEASEKEAQRLREDLGRAQGLAYQLNQQAMHIRGSMSSMQQRLVSEEATGQAARAEAAALRSRLEILQGHLAAGGDMAHHDKASREAILRNELHSALQHLECEQDSSKQLRAQVDNLERQVAMLTVEKEKANSRVAELTARLAESQQAVDGYAERLKEERAARDDATAAVMKLQTVIMSAKCEMEEATCTVENAREELGEEKLAREAAMRAMSGLGSDDGLEMLFGDGDGLLPQPEGELVADDMTPGSWSPAAPVEGTGMQPEKADRPSVGSWEPEVSSSRSRSALEYAKAEMQAMKASNEEVWKLVELEQATIHELRKELSSLREKQAKKPK